MEIAGGSKREISRRVYDQILFIEYVSWNEGLGKYNRQ